MNEIDILNNSKSVGENEAFKIKQLHDELESSGGVNRYQEASIVSTSHFKTSRWVMSVLTQLGHNPSIGTKCSQQKLRVLEIGAINIQLQKCSWLDVRSIDLHSQHPLIEEIGIQEIPHFPHLNYKIL